MARSSMLVRAAGTMVALSLAAAPVSAQLYNNGAPNGVGGNEMTEWIQAEDFSFGTPTTLTGVTFWALTNGGYQGSISWQIYGNNVGVPGSVLFNGSVSPTPTLFPAATCCGLTGYELDFTLPNINLTAGTYWLGLHNGPYTTTTRDEFHWATTNNNSTSTAEEDIGPTFGDGWSNNGNEHAFELFGTAAAVTPEPATLSLLATGLVGLMGSGMFRRRRKAA